MAELPRVPSELVVSRPAEHVLLVRIAREKQMNALTPELQVGLGKVFDWYEQQPDLWCAVLTGTGKAFCAGRDLKSWLLGVASPSFSPAKEASLAGPNGFGGVSTRPFTKPLVCALNGLCLGGGAEMAMNGDVIVGYRDILFGFPEVKRGVAARLGGIPALYRASSKLVPYLITGRPIPSSELSTHIFTTTVASADEVLPEALKWAAAIVAASPDSVKVTREQIRMIKTGVADRDVVLQGARGSAQLAMYSGANFAEGLRCFEEKREPRWVNLGTLAKL